MSVKSQSIDVDFMGKRLLPVTMLFFSLVAFIMQLADLTTFFLEIDVNILTVKRHFMWKRPFREIPCFQ